MKRIMRNYKFHKFIKIILLVIYVSFLSGFVSNRGVLDIKMREVPDPDSKRVVKIINVRDMRNFDLKPKKPSVPSLMDGDIDNKSITLRAIARKRNGLGMYLGDILLPEDKTVEDLVYEAVQNALREKGYSVVNKDNDSVFNPILLDVDIVQFWAWRNGEIAVAPLSFETVVKMKDMELRLFRSSVEMVRGEASFKTEIIDATSWELTITRGIKNLVNNIKGKLKDPALPGRTY